MINLLIITILAMLCGVLIGMDISNSVWKKRIDDLMEDKHGKDQDF